MAQAWWPMAGRMSSIAAGVMQENVLAGARYSPHQPASPQSHSVRPKGALALTDTSSWRKGGGVTSRARSASHMHIFAVTSSEHLPSVKAKPIYFLGVIPAASAFYYAIMPLQCFPPPHIPVGMPGLRPDHQRRARPGRQPHSALSKRQGKSRYPSPSRFALSLNNSYH